jgi:hypothetical protein
MGAARAAGTARVVLVLAALIALAGLGAGSAAADGNINAKHFFWAPGQSPQGTVDSVANNIIYHGGNAGPGAIGIQKKPAVYLIYWGTEWANGFSTLDTNGKAYSSKTLQNYLNTFMANLGGSPWGCCADAVLP